MGDTGGQLTVLNDGGQGRLVADVAHPARELRVPHQSVAADRLVVLLRPIDEVVGAAVAHGAARGLGGVPLHRVLRGELAKVGLDDASVLRVGQGALVGARTEVELALGLDQLVDARMGLASNELGGGREGGQGRQEQNECRLHLDWAK